MEYVGIVAILALLQYFMFAFRVGGLRQKTGEAATEIPEDETLKRAIRVHLNTAEMLLLFLPLLVLSACFFRPGIAAGIGVLWIIGRFLYSQGYMKDRKSRFPGFLIGNLAILALLLTALYGIVTGLMAS